MRLRQHLNIAALSRSSFQYNFHPHFQGQKSTNEYNHKQSFAVASELRLYCTTFRPLPTFVKVGLKLSVYGLQQEARLIQKNYFTELYFILCD